jgi:hypothetical protein
MGIRGKADRYAFRLMKRGGNSVPGALAALAALLVVAAPAPLAAAAAPQEYDLTLPGAGSGGGSEGSSSSGEATAPTGVVPTAPTVTSPTTIESTEGKGGGKKQRKPDRPEGPTHPVLTASAVNATAGPQEVPPLKVDSDESGSPPTLALVLAFVAAACCILALWRLRFLRELPAAPRPRSPRAEASS